MANKKIRIQRGLRGVHWLAASKIVESQNRSERGANIHCQLKAFFIPPVRATKYEDSAEQFECVHTNV